MAFCQVYIKIKKHLQGAPVGLHILAPFSFKMSNKSPKTMQQKSNFQLWKTHSRQRICNNEKVQIHATTYKFSDQRILESMAETFSTEYEHRQLVSQLGYKRAAKARRFIYKVNSVVINIGIDYSGINSVFIESCIVSELCENSSFIIVKYIVI